MITVRFDEISYAAFDRRHVRSAFGRAARVFAKNLKNQVRGSGSGRSYVIGGRKHTASAPGRPPARFTGNLYRSITGRASRRGYALVVSAIAPHAHLLELGTSRMAERLYFDPTFEDRAVVVDVLRGAYERALMGVKGAAGRPPKSVEIN